MLAVAIPVVSTNQLQKTGRCLGCPANQEGKAREHVHCRV